MKRVQVALAVLYVLAAVITFGHVTVRAERACYSSYGCPADILVAGGLLAGAAWPLYWSWDLQR